MCDGWCCVSVGARELRRLSHDSIWLLVNSACGSSAAHQKLLYLCLVKARELYNHGKGSVSLEVKQRLKRAACSGKASGESADGTERTEHRAVMCRGRE